MGLVRRGIPVRPKKIAAPVMQELRRLHRPERQPEMALDFRQQRIQALRDQAPARTAYIGLVGGTPTGIGYAAAIWTAELRARATVARHFIDEAGA
jgi:hypothetical protein